MQRLSNEIVGPEHEAVELIPEGSHLVNAANQHHLNVAEKLALFFLLEWLEDRLIMTSSATENQGTLGRLKETSMAFKLKKKEITERDNHVHEIEEAYSTLKSAIGEFNATIQEHREKIEEAQTKYHEVVHDAREWVQETIGEHRANLDERSERWKDSQAGRTADAWVEQWENLDMDPTSVELPEDLEAPDENIAEELANLPEAAGEEY